MKSESLKLSKYQLLSYFIMFSSSFISYYFIFSFKKNNFY